MDVDGDSFVTEMGMFEIGCSCIEVLMGVLSRGVLSLDSSMEGSTGGGPSRAQRLDSYFDRMNESILLRYLSWYVYCR